MQNRKKSGYWKVIFFDVILQKKRLDLVFFLKNIQVPISQIVDVRFSSGLTFWKAYTEISIFNPMNYYSTSNGLAAILKNRVFTCDFQHLSINM